MLFCGIIWPFFDDWAETDLRISIYQESPMKILVGVDEIATAERLSAQVASLGFANAKVDLAFAIEILGAAVAVRPDTAHTSVVNEFVRMQTELAKSVLSGSEKAFKDKGLPTTTKVLTGMTGNALVNHAKETAADLLVVGHSGKNALERVIIGSVSRKVLLSAQQSILISKQPESAVKPVTLVLATDHSDYANRCIDKLLSWKPQNVERVVVTTVYPEQLLKAMGAVIEHFKADVSTWVKDGLAKNNATIVDKVKSTLPSAKVTSRVESGYVSDTLERVMKEEKADLLVLGAQGHGFVDLITLGSVSLDQAVRHDYSVLVVRA